jgi:hypothetical protein
MSNGYYVFRFRYFYKNSARFSNVCDCVCACYRIAILNIDCVRACYRIAILNIDCVCACYRIAILNIDCCFAHIN